MTRVSDTDILFDDAIHQVRRRFEIAPKVAIAGFGNAGKSSLFNAIYGEKRAAVSMRTDETQQAQTENRFGIDFTDTPGIGTGQFSLARIEQTGVFDRQHVIIHVFNGTTAISSEDEALHQLAGQSSARRITVVNKCDLLDAQEQREFLESLRQKLGLNEDEVLFVSAKKNLYVDRLVQRIADVLPEAMQDAFIGQQRADLQLKERRIRALIYSKAAVCAGVALTPLPLADAAVITPIQVGMVTAIGYFHGVQGMQERVPELLGVLGVGMGFREAARQLVKLVPGAGSMISAAIAFGGTVALGETANVWFRRRMNVPAEELRQLFRLTAQRARDEYDQQRKPPTT